MISYFFLRVSEVATSCCHMGGKSRSHPSKIVPYIWHGRGFLFSQHFSVRIVLWKKYGFVRRSCTDQNWFRCNYTRYFVWEISLDPFNAGTFYTEIPTFCTMINWVVFGAISNFRQNLRNPNFKNFINNFLAKYSYFLWENCVLKCPTLVRGSDAKVNLLAHVSHQWLRCPWCLFAFIAPREHIKTREDHLIAPVYRCGSTWRWVTSAMGHLNSWIHFCLLSIEDLTCWLGLWNRMKPPIS